MECHVLQPPMFHILLLLTLVFMTLLDPVYSMPMDENDDHSRVWTLEIDACIRGNNNEDFNKITLSNCKRLCQESSCRSIEYNSREMRCTHSTATSRSPSYVQPCFIDGWTFTEIIEWTPEINACIRNNNNEVVDQISLSNCKTLCQASPCRSIEYNSKQVRCILSTATSRSSSFVQPCYIDGWSFTEIIDPCPPPSCNCPPNQNIEVFVNENGCEECRCVFNCPAPSCFCPSNQKVEVFVNDNGCEECRCVFNCPAPLCFCPSNQKVEWFVNENGCEECRCVFNCPTPSCFCPSNQKVEVFVNENGCEECRCVFTCATRTVIDTIQADTFGGRPCITPNCPTEFICPQNGCKTATITQTVLVPSAWNQPVSPTPCYTLSCLPASTQAVTCGNQGA